MSAATKLRAERARGSSGETASTRATQQRTLAAVLALLTVGLATVALLGPLASGVIEYHLTETLRNQMIGLDAVALFVVAPLAARREQRARRDLYHSTLEARTSEARWVIESAPTRVADGPEGATGKTAASVA